MGINLGALFGPIVAGKIAEGIDWHLGLACAGVGMTLGLIQYVAGRSRLQPALDRLAARPKPATESPGLAPGVSQGGFTAEDWKRMAAVVVFFLFASLFWGAYEQAGSTLTLFADRYVRLELLSLKLYASWFVSVQAAFVILLSPVFAWLWVRLGPRQPSSPAKFALALMFVGLAFVLLMPAGAAAQGGVKVSPLWLVGGDFIEELGEGWLYPVGLSVVQKPPSGVYPGLAPGVGHPPDSGSQPPRACARGQSPSPADGASGAPIGMCRCDGFCEPNKVAQSNVRAETDDEMYVIR